MSATPNTVLARDAVSTRNRLDFLDGIRGTAALLVVLQHALEHWYPAFALWSSTYLNLGRVGIVAFFLVSGYVIGLTLTRQTIRTFAVRRLWRLYPVYWLATIVWIVVDLPSGRFDDYGLFVIAANLVMVQGGIPGIAAILPPAWTLGIELLYYVQSAVAKAFGKLRLSVLLGYLWLACFGAMAGANAHLGTDFTGVSPLMLLFASLGLSIFIRDSQGGREWIGLLATAVTVVPVLSMMLLQEQPAGPQWEVLSFNFSNAVGIALFAAFYYRRSSPVMPAVLWLGAISYALYLFHAPVMSLIQRIDPPTALAVVLVVSVSLGAAWIVHRFVEQPSIEVGRRLSEPLART